MEWLTEKFPGISKGNANDIFQIFWLSYESSFETIIAAWDEVRAADLMTQVMSCAVRS